MSAFVPATTAGSRVFLIENEAGPRNQPSFESCLKGMGLDISLGDIEKIECPDPNRYGQFIEVGQIRGAESRPTTSIVGRYAIDLKSELLRLARKRCSSDVQIHFGTCSDPSDFNTFTKALIYTGAAITNYSTEDLGALASDENAKIDETVDISMTEAFEFFPVSYSVKGADAATNEIIDVIICDAASCGDCEDPSDGCEKAFAITIAAGGSPGTPADVVFSLDKGLNWEAHDIDTYSATDDPTGVACVGVNLVVVSNERNGLDYAPLADFDGTTDPDFTAVTTGFVVGGEPNDIWSVGTFAFIVGDGGFVYGTSDPTTSVTVLDAGVALTDDLNAVHAISDTFAVAVGNASAVIKTSNQTSWEEITPPAGGGVNLNTIWVKTEKEWWTGGSDGNLYYTTDGGTTWTIKAFPGSGSGVIRDIQFPKDSIGYLSHDTTGTVGRILESIDGGFSWIVAPRGTGTLALNDRINALATCSDDVDFVVGVGLADDAADGFIIVGDN